MNKFKRVSDFPKNSELVINNIMQVKESEISLHEQLIDAIHQFVVIGAPNQVYDFSNFPLLCFYFLFIGLRLLLHYLIFFKADHIFISLFQPTSFQPAFFQLQRSFCVHFDYVFQNLVKFMNLFLQIIDFFLQNFIFHFDIILNN